MANSKQASNTSFEELTWTNLQADIYLALHADGVRMYLDSVINASLNAVERRHDELSNSEDPSVVFLLGDIEALLTSSIEAFALSVQSIWERQLRAFLAGCAQELGRTDAEIKTIQRKTWPELVASFADLRGVPMSVFDSFETLETLQLVGNACRHGDGVSANRLFDRRPDLWPYWPPKLPENWPGPPLVVPPYPPFSEFSMPRRFLTDMATAVIWFWDDHNYLYTHSIQRKSQGAINALAEMRRVRAERKNHAELRDRSGHAASS